MMNSYLMCTFEGHENEQIIGFCVNESCTQIPQFCLQCLKERHKSHVDDCKNFQQYQEIAIKSLKQQQQELDELEKVYNQINKAYKQYSQILVNEISKITKLIEMFAQRQYYDIKSLISTQNYSQKSFILKTQCMCQKYFQRTFQFKQKHNFLISFIQTIENAIKGVKKPNLSQEFVQQPIKYENDKVQAQDLFKQGMKLRSRIQENKTYGSNKRFLKRQIFSTSQSNMMHPMMMFIDGQVAHYKKEYFTKTRQSNQEEQMKHQMYAILQFQLILKMIQHILQRLLRQSHFLYNYTIFEQRRYDDVIIWCDKGLKINPQNDAAFVNKGLTCIRINLTMIIEQGVYTDIKRNQCAMINQQRQIERMKQLTQTKVIQIQINRLCLSSGIDLLEELNRQKQYQEAIQCSDELLRINSQLHQAYSIKGIALNMKQKQLVIYELSQYKEAVKQFDKAYQISKLVEYLVLKADSLLPYNFIQLVFYSGQRRQSKQLYIEAKNKGYQDIEYLERKISEI